MVATILVVASDRELRREIAAAFPENLWRIVAVDSRSEAMELFSEDRQVMVYALHYADDLDWLTKTMSQYEHLRIVYLSRSPWASLRYDRARCMISPSNPRALLAGALVDLVSQLMPVPLPRHRGSALRLEPRNR